MSITIQKKYGDLQKLIVSYKSVVIGFSGGVDSTFLSKVAYDVLGNLSIAVIGVSPSYPTREEEEAIKIANDIGISYITIETEEMNVEKYRLNQGDRCYHCKKELYTKLQQIKAEYNFNEILDGTNYSDLNDIRPGFKATEELNIKKPLLEACLTKEEIRTLSKELALPTWDKPSFACLSSRFPVGTEITKDSLSIVERGEQVLYELGFRQFRLRYYEKLARIELLEEDFPKVIDKSIRNKIIDSLSQLGFSHVTLDLLGYGTRLKNKSI